MRKEQAALPDPKLNRKTGLYERDLGLKDKGDGKLIPHRFYCGKNKGEAQLRILRLEQAWAAVQRRWQRSRHTPQARWDRDTLLIGKAISNGEHVCRLSFFKPFDREPLDNLADVAVNWLRDLQEDFPMIHLTLDDEGTEERGEAKLDLKISELRHEADRLERKNTSQTLHDALKAFRDNLTTFRPKYLDLNGEPTATAQNAMKEADRLSEHVEDLPLRDLNLEKIEAWERYWERRPTSKRGKHMTPKTCENTVKRLRMFLKWLHREKKYSWRKPDDYEPRRLEFHETQEERAKRGQTRQVQTYNLDELVTLYRHAKPMQRLLMLLGLNCGFGRMEIGSLHFPELHLDVQHSEYDLNGSFIFKIRQKSGVYGEWQLWDTTVQGLKWYLAERVKTDAPEIFVTNKGTPIVKKTVGGNKAATVSNAWYALTERVRKLEGNPEFRRLSFGKIRKTAINGVRKVSGGEVAGVFACHGTPVKSDELLDVYSDRDFETVFNGIRLWGERLKPMFNAVPEPFTPTKRKHAKKPSYLAQRREVVRLRDEEGLTLKKIEERLGISFRAVRHHLTQAAKEGGQR